MNPSPCDLTMWPSCSSTRPRTIESCAPMTSSQARCRAPRPSCERRRRCRAPVPGPRSSTPPSPPPARRRSGSPRAHARLPCAWPTRLCASPRRRPPRSPRGSQPRSGAGRFRTRDGTPPKVAGDSMSRGPRCAVHSSFIYMIETVGAPKQGQELKATGPHVCPQCGERVSAFAAGCAICGAELDPSRAARPAGRGGSDRLGLARAAAPAAAHRPSRSSPLAESPRRLRARRRGRRW
jgi:hypothetical protein